MPSFGGLLSKVLYFLVFLAVFGFGNIKGYF